MRKTICYLLLVWGTVFTLNAQEGVVTNYFLPSRMDTRGEVDSLFQVNYSVYENESAPTYYKYYVFDDNGHVISMIAQDHGAYASIGIITHYEDNKAIEEVVSLPYLEEDTNSFVYNTAGKVKEIRNKQALINIQYDTQQRITQIDHAYSDGVIFETKKYNYPSSADYTVIESSEDDIQSVAEYKDGKCIKTTLGNDGISVTTYRYNKQGDCEEMKIIEAKGGELVIKTVYEYDDRGNWIKSTTHNYPSGEKPYSDGYTTRKIIYRDGHATGYDVSY